jgi:hypothetical protein
LIEPVVFANFTKGKLGEQQSLILHEDSDRQIRAEMAKIYPPVRGEWVTVDLYWKANSRHEHRKVKC